MIRITPLRYCRRSGTDLQNCFESQLKVFEVLVNTELKVLRKGKENMEKRLCLVNTRKSLEQERNYILAELQEAETQELYNALMEELNEVEQDIMSVEFEMGELL